MRPSRSTRAPPGATFTCKLDTAAPAACTSPRTYSALTQAAHTFTVFATLNGIADPTPAAATWTVDTTPPTAPTGLTASWLSPTSVKLTWIAATDNTGVTGYDVIRDGAPLATIGAVTTYTDSTVTAGTTPVYTVKAFDVAGNRSPASASATPPPPPAAQLTRMPYLTDLVGLNATVNFATDRSIGVASVKFGPSNGGTCSLTTTVPATRITIVGERDLRVPVEGAPHAARDGKLLLPRLPGHGGPARRGTRHPSSRRRSRWARRARSRSPCWATGDRPTRPVRTRTRPAS